MSESDRPKSSVAQRVRALCEGLTRGNERLPTWRVWNQALGLPDTDNFHAAILPVIHAIRITARQLEELRIILHSMGQLNSETIDQPIERWLSVVTSMPSHLNSKWDQIRPSLSADMMQSLKVYDALVPKTEVTVDHADLVGMLEEVRALRATFRASTLTPEFRDVLLALLAIIEEAITDYAVLGEAAIRAAWGNFFVFASTRNTEPKSDVDRDAQGAFNKLFQKFKDLTEPVVHVSSLIDAMEKGKSLVLMGIKLLTHDG